MAREDAKRTMWQCVAVSAVPIVFSMAADIDRVLLGCTWGAECYVDGLSDFRRFDMAFVVAAAIIWPIAAVKFRIAWKDWRKSEI
jgi:hypothetical protein